MNGEIITEDFWKKLSQEEKNEIVYKSIVQINAKLDRHKMVNSSFAIAAGFVGGVFAHIGERIMGWK